MIMGGDIEFKDSDKSDVLMYAFRYALGRRTYAVSTMVGVLLDNWDALCEWEQGLIQREIREYKELHGSLGDNCDESAWGKILNNKK